MARAMEHSLLARRLCLTLDMIVLQTRVRPYHIGPDSGMSSLALASRPATARNAHGARVGLSHGSDALLTLSGGSDRTVPLRVAATALFVGLASSLALQTFNASFK